MNREEFKDIITNESVPIAYQYIISRIKHQVSITNGLLVLITSDDISQEERESYAAIIARSQEEISATLGISHDHFQARL